MNGTLYHTFQAAARARGLLRNDNEWVECLKKAALFQVSASQLRRLLAVILTQCQPADPASLWNKFRDEFSADFQYRRRQSLGNELHGLTEGQKEECYINALRELDICLRIYGLSLS